MIKFLVCRPNLTADDAALTGAEPSVILDRIAEGELLSGGPASGFQQ